jgi:hypothetical protein
MAEQPRGSLLPKLDQHASGEIIFGNCLLSDNAAELTGWGMLVATDLKHARNAVVEVWSKLVPGTPFQEQLTWSEAGVDSLKSLHFLLHLEALLERPLSFDLFARELTLGEVIRRVAEVSASDEDALPEGRTIFLSPGIFGDEPILADFRHSLRSRLNCRLLDLPQLDQSPAVLSDIRATAALSVKYIEAQQPDGPVIIGGYSYGALVAYQTAVDLLERGRTI